MGNPIANAQGDNLLYGGETDPRVNAIDMPANAVYIYAPPSGVGALLRKQDNGATTNFDTLVTDAMARDFSNAQPAANAIDLNSQLINNLADPVASQDAATKNYVDNEIASIPAPDLSSRLAVDGSNSLNNDSDLAFRNAADSADIVVMNLNGSDQLQVGSSNVAQTIVSGGVGNLTMTSSSQIDLNGQVNGNVFVNSTNGQFGVFVGGVISLDNSKAADVNINGDNVNLSSNTLNLNSDGAIYIDNGQSDEVVVTADDFIVNAGAIGLNAPGGSIDTGVNTGAVNLNVASGGDFTFLEQGNAPAIGDVWTASTTGGKGYWAPPAAGGANTSLSNLVGLPEVNSPLAPSLADDNTLSLGLADRRWSTVNAKTAQFGTSFGTINRLQISDVPSAPATGAGLTWFSSNETSFAVGARPSGPANGPDLDLFTFNVGNFNTGSINIFTGNNIGASGNSGDINLTIGSAITAQGNFKFLKTGVAPSVGDVWTASAVDGTGYWAAPSGGGDAWSDPVDSNIAPAVANDGAFNLGASGQEFNQGWIRQLHNTANGNIAIDFNTSGQMTLTGNVYPVADGTGNIGFETGGRAFSKFVAREFIAVRTGTNIPGVVFRGQDASFDGIRLDVYKTMPSGFIPAGYAGELGNSSEGFGIGSENTFSAEPSGPVHIESGNVVNGISGNIELRTGVPSGTGTRGKIKLDALMATLPTGTANPTGTDVGDCYFNTTDDTLRVWNGTNWVSVALT